MSRSGSRTTRMRERAELLLLYFGEAWNSEQMTSQARQPLHLSTLIVIDLMVFLILAMADDSSLLQVFGDAIQVQFAKRFRRRYAVAVPALELVVGVQQVLFQLGEALLPVVFGRLVVGTPHAPSHVDGAQQRAVARGRLPQFRFVEFEAGPGRHELREVVDVIGGLEREGREPGAHAEGVVDVVHLFLPVDDVAAGL